MLRVVRSEHRSSEPAEREAPDHAAAHDVHAVARVDDHVSTVAVRCTARSRLPVVVSRSARVPSEMNSCRRGRA